MHLNYSVISLSHLINDIEKNNLRYTYMTCITFTYVHEDMLVDFQAKCIAKLYIDSDN